MRRRAVLFVLLAGGCASTGNEARPAAAIPLAAPTREQLPAGEVVRTAREIGFGAMVDELADADVVYVSEAPVRLGLRVVQQLAARGHLHAIGLYGVDRSRQQGIDVTGDDLASGPYADVIAFARRIRVPLVALGLPPEILATVEADGVDALPDDVRRELPAFDAPADLAEEAAADAIVRWSRTAPDRAQMVVLADTKHLAPRARLPERTRRRIGGAHLVVAAVPTDAQPPGVHGRSFADFVWLVE